jgi:c-di-GMP-binding flagellar brake protein YcgR
MDFERRGSVRVPCDLSSSFRIIDSIQDTTSCFASDISNGGVKLVVRKFIRLTDRLILSLNISKYRTVEIRVAPAWIREDPAISSFYIGTQFVEISKDAKIAIQSFQTASKPSPPS